jgi:hypothetical protein
MNYDGWLANLPFRENYSKILEVCAGTQLSLLEIRTVA